MARVMLAMMGKFFLIIIVFAFHNFSGKNFKAWGKKNLIGTFIHTFACAENILQFQTSFEIVSLVVVEIGRMFSPAAFATKCHANVFLTNSRQQRQQYLLWGPHLYRFSYIYIQNYVDMNFEYSVRAIQLFCTLCIMRCCFDLSCREK